MIDILQLYAQSLAFNYAKQQTEGSEEEETRTRGHTMFVWVPSSHFLV